MEEKNIKLVSWQSKVRDYECDSMGVVYHTNYFNYLEEARKEFLEIVKIPLFKLTEKNLCFSAVTHDVSYRNALKKNDEFVVETKMERLSTSKFHFIQNIYRSPEKLLIIESNSVSQIYNFKEDRPEWAEELEMVFSDFPLLKSSN